MPALASLLGIAAVVGPSTAAATEPTVEVVAREPLRGAAPSLRAAGTLVQLGESRYHALARAGQRSTTRTFHALAGLGAAGRGVARQVCLAEGFGLELSSSALVRDEFERAAARQPDGAAASASEHLARRYRAFAAAAELAQPVLWRAVYAEALPGASGAPPAELDGLAFAAGLWTQAELAGSLLAPASDGRFVLVGEPASLATKRSAAIYEGLCHLYAAMARVHAIAHELTTDGKALGPVDLAAYDPYARPRWLPRTTAVETSAAGKRTLSPADARSDLAAHALALLAIVRLHELFGQGGALAPLLEGVGHGTGREVVWQRAQLVEAREVGRFLYRNLVAVYFDPAPERRSFASHSDRGLALPGVTLEDLGLALEAVARGRRLFDTELALLDESKRVLLAQLASLEAVKPGPKARWPAALGFPPENAAGASPAGPADAGDVAGLVRGLLAVGEALDEPRARALAADALAALEEHHFDPWTSLYIEPAATRARITPASAGRVLLLLGDLGLRQGRPEAILRLEDTTDALQRLEALPDPRTGAAHATMVEVRR